MRYLTIALIILALLFAGCSGNGGNTVAPEPVAAIEGSSAASHQFWGLWQFVADPAAQNLDVVQLRSPSMHLNALPFLEPPALVNLTLESLEFNGNIIEADIGLRHPFLGLTEFTGFDVCGLLITNGSVTGFSDSALRMAGAGDTRLLNPDGYTRWWNPAEFPHNGTMFGYKDGLLGTPDSIANFNSTLNAYKFFCDELNDPDEAVSNVPSSSRCVFSAGQKNIRHYTIELGDDGLVFNYAVDANWVFPTGDPPYTAPDDFELLANRPEAWNIDVTEISNTLWNDGSSSGGGLSLDIDLYDHFNPVANMLYVESPGNFAPLGPIPGEIIDEYTAYYHFETTSATPGANSIELLVIAESDSVGYDGHIPGEPVSAYFTYTAMVGGSGDMPPVAAAEIVTSEPWCPGDDIEFDASASYDPDGGSIVSYEWDFDGDGTYGDAYDSGTDVNPTLKFNYAGTFDVDVRVTDDESDTDTLDEPLPLAVGGPTWVDDDAVTPYDGSFDHPWPTIQDGINNLNTDCPGSGWVLVKAGTYTENISIPSNVTVEGYSDTAPLIQSPGGSTSSMVSMSGSSTVLKHFRVKPMTTQYAIYSSGGGNVVDDIEFIDNPGGPTCSYGVYVSASGTTGATVNNVRCDGYHKSGSGFIRASGAYNTITNNVVLNLLFDAPSDLNVFYINSNYGSNSPNLLVAKNVAGHITHAATISDTEWCNVIALDYFGGATFRNNLIFDIVNKHTGGWTWGIDCYRCVGSTFEHNTLSSISGPAWIYAFETTDYYADPSTTTHRDHIITDLTAGTMNWRWAYLGNFDSAYTLPVDYSCAYNVGNPFYNEVVQGVGFVASSPQFLDKPNDDYRVSSGSPCSGTAHDYTDRGAYGGSDPLTWLPE